MSDSTTLAPISATAQQLQVGQLSPRAVVMRDLNQHIPNTEYHLPAYIFRADMIPAGLHDLSAKDQSQFTEAATLELDYVQGFPTLPDGEPFWSQLPAESPEAYRAFIAYLDMPRQESDFGGAEGLAAPVRQLHLLKTQLGLPIGTLMSYAVMYYWIPRSKAYDMFILASHSKQKHYRLLEAENNHYRLAGKFLAYAESFLDEVFTDPERFELRPNEAINLLMKMVQVQRLSLGVSPMGAHQGNNGSNAPSKAASLEVILRGIAQESGELAKATQDDEAAARKLFEDPTILEAAQQLIIQLNTARSPRKPMNMTASGLDNGEDELADADDESDQDEDFPVISQDTNNDGLDDKSGDFGEFPDAYNEFDRDTPELGEKVDPLAALDEFDKLDKQ
jgi:hypothetical protein